jgi:hypothetical protein
MRLRMLSCAPTSCHCCPCPLWNCLLRHIEGLPWGPPGWHSSSSGYERGGWGAPATAAAAGVSRGNAAHHCLCAETCCCLRPAVPPRHPPLDKGTFAMRLLRVVAGAVMPSPPLLCPHRQLLLLPEPRYHYKYLLPRIPPRIPPRHPPGNGLCAAWLLPRHNRGTNLVSACWQRGC